MKQLIEPSSGRKALLIARALAHPLRSQIVNIVRQSGEICVTDIYTHPSFRDRRGRYMEQSQCSQNLAILRKTNILKARREGKIIFYSVSDIYEKAMSLLSDLSDLYDGRTDRGEMSQNGTPYAFTNLG